MNILMYLLIIIVLLVVIVTISLLWSFLASVPNWLERIVSAMERRNTIEKEKLEIMKNNNQE